MVGLVQQKLVFQLFPADILELRTLVGLVQQKLVQLLSLLRIDSWLRSRMMCVLGLEEQTDKHIRRWNHPKQVLVRSF